MTDLWEGLEAATERPLRPVPDQPADTGHHDHAAEVAILAGCAWDPSAIEVAAAEGITGTSFHRLEHEIIWNSLRTLRASDAPTDHAALADELRRRATKPALRALVDLPGIYTTVAEATAVPHHARTVVRHARARHGATLALRLKQAYESPDPDFERIEGLLRDHLEDQAASATRATSTWQRVDLGPILAGSEDTSPRPSLLTRRDGVHLLYPRYVHSVSGEPGCGKSFLAHLCVVQEIEAGNDVVYLDFEDRAESIVQRLRDMGATDQQIATHVRYVRPEAALDPASQTHIESEAAGTTLAVVDGITEAMTLHGLSLMDNEDVARWLDLVPRRLADLGPAVLQIDHVVKSTEARGRYAIGGQHKLAGITGVAYKMTTIHSFGRGVKGRARLVIDKDRHGHVGPNGSTPAELTIDATDPSGVLYAWLDTPAVDHAEDGTWLPTGYMEKVSRWLEINPGASGSAIEKAITGKRDHIRAAIAALVTAGHIRTENGPRNALHHHVEKPYREDESWPS